MNSCKSMTGYGRGESASSKLGVTIEIRAVNHRFVDLQWKMPRLYSSLEAELSAIVRERVARGRIEIFVRREPIGASRFQVRFDKDLARALAEGARELGEELGLPGTFSISQLIAVPGVLQVDEQDGDALVEAADLKAALRLALDSLLEMRVKEGAALAVDVGARLDAVVAIRQTIAAAAEDQPQAFRERIERRVALLLAEVPIDPARLAQEAAILADKADIDEELSRLDSHIAQARDLLLSGEPAGRKLDFLAQELLRETNTIGSKCGDPGIAAQIVALKSEVEKIKEQVANIE